MPTTITLAHIPASLPLYIAFYQKVSNAAYLREQLLAGNSAFEYAFIDASMILSRSHILSACFRALNDHLHGRLKSRNVHSEMVFALSPNNNIGEAFRRFGISDTTTDLLVIKVSTEEKSVTAEEVAQHLSEAIQGEEIIFDDEHLAAVCDETRVRKVYKLAQASSKGAAKPDATKDAVSGGGRDRAELEGQVVGLMAIRGAT